jgi:hypothetical protein
VIKRGDRDTFRKKLVEIGGANMAERATLSFQACDYAMSSFNHDNQVVRYLDLFKKLLANKAG